MAEKTADDLFKLIKDENVEYVDIRFCDLPGVVQHFNGPITIGSKQDAKNMAHSLAHKLQFGQR